MMPRRFPLAMLILALGSCAGPAPVVPPAPRPIAATPVRSVPVQPASTDWRDWPFTPGNWTYAAQAGGSTAQFGQAGAPLLTLTCDLSTRQVRLIKSGGVGDMTIRTSTALRALPMGAAVSANDPLLDAIGFSRGRFVVQQAGAPALVLPTWTEIDRVVQDCRS